MKKLLLFTLSILILTAGQVQGQLLITHPNETTDLSGTTITVEFDTDNIDHEYSVWVKNLSETETYTLACRRIETEVLAGTKNNTCWSLCPFPAWDAGANEDWVVSAGANILTETIGPGETATSFAFHYEPEELLGISTFEIRFVSSDNVDNTVGSFNLKFDHDEVDGVEDVAGIDLFTMNPNPANESVNLNLKGISGNTQVKVYNVLGEVVLDRTDALGGQLFNMETSELQNGIYMVSILQNNEIIKTSRLMIKH